MKKYLHLFYNVNFNKYKNFLMYFMYFAGVRRALRVVIKIKYLANTCINILVY